MPRRDRYDDDDYDDRRYRRRKKKSNTGLIVGLSVGGGVLLLVVLLLLTGGRRGGGPGVGPIGVGVRVKPEGRKTVGNFEEADDPTLVDRVWPRLLGKWVEIDGGPSHAGYEFLPDYSYRTTWTEGGRTTDEVNPVLVVRDDSLTTGAKAPECYSMSYHVREGGGGRAGNILVNVFPDGTLDIGNRQFRRAK